MVNFHGFQPPKRRKRTVPDLDPAAVAALMHFLAVGYEAVRAQAMEPGGKKWRELHIAVKGIAEGLAAAGGEPGPAGPEPSLASMKAKAEALWALHLQRRQRKLLRLAACFGAVVAVAANLGFFAGAFFWQTPPTPVELPSDAMQRELERLEGLWEEVEALRFKVDASSRLLLRETGSAPVPVGGE
jgi:hypothetical protein